MCRRVVVVRHAHHERSICFSEMLYSSFSFIHCLWKIEKRKKTASIELPWRLNSFSLHSYSSVLFSWQDARPNAVVSKPPEHRHLPEMCLWQFQPRKENLNQHSSRHHRNQDSLMKMRSGLNRLMSDLPATIRKSFKAIWPPAASLTIQTNWQRLITRILSAHWSVWPI